jgi:hypothetical protein
MMPQTVCFGSESRRLSHVFHGPTLTLPASTDHRARWERLMSINPITTKNIAAAWYQPSRSPINAMAWMAAKAGVRVSDAAVSTGPLRVSEML